MKKDVLVLQFRTDQSLEHERDCFNQAFDSFAPRFQFVNAIEDNLEKVNLDEYNGVILGGSGEFCFSEGAGEGGWRSGVENLLDKVFERNIHTLGVCLGAQLLTLHQGGDITDEEKYRESGVYQVSLNEKSQECDIFSRVDKDFHATLAHKDTPINIPENFVPLAESDSVSCQAFKVSNKPIWGTLFHPELNQERLDYRLKLYPSYLENEDLYNRVMKNFADTSHSSKVLHHFYRELPVD